ncbi:putative peroxidase [Helianthus annuus]|nr:putative peroxidase [Helianthus annuus]
MEALSPNRKHTLLVVLLATLITLAVGQGTRLGFYRTSCPRVESIVQSAVQSAIRSNPAMAPGLLRMFFHDCFVNGCDASILLDSFEVIDAAKTQLETACPGVVSCADILALAARDSVVQTGGTGWPVPLGRRDGLVSRAADTANLPALTTRLVSKSGSLLTRVLTPKILSTYNRTAACALFSYRLYNFNNTNGPDPTIDTAFLPTLRNLCPNGGDGSRRVDLDTGSVGRFDNSYYSNLRNRRECLNPMLLYGMTRQHKGF